MAMKNSMLKRTLSALVVAPLMGVIFLYLLNLAAGLIPVEALAEKMETAFTEGHISEIDWPYIETAGYRGNLGYDQYTDCLIYMSTVLRTEDRFRDAATSYVIWWWPFSESTPSTWTRCGSLREIITTARDQDLTEYYYPYHRYLLGHRSLAAVGIRIASVAVFKGTLRYATYGLLLVVILLAARRVIAARNKQQNIIRGQAPVGFYAAMGVLAVSFLLFYGLNYFAGSISHAMSDLVIFLFLLVALRVDLLRVREGVFVSLIAGFGVLTGFFELLNGATPIGAALVILAVGMRVSAKSDLREANIRVAAGLVLFLGCIALPLLLKQLFAAMAFSDDVLGVFVEKLLERTIGPSVSGTVVSGLDVYAALFENISQLTYGSWQLGLLIFSTSVCLLVFVAGFTAFRGSSVERYNLFVILLSNVLLAGWFAVFAQHAVVHAVWMVRVLVVTMACGGMLSAILLTRRGWPWHARAATATGS